MASSSTTATTKTFDTVHHIIQSHLAAGNALAAHVAMTLNNINTDPEFWLTCHYHCGLASAVIASHLETTGDTQQQQQQQSMMMDSQSFVGYSQTLKGRKMSELHLSQSLNHDDDETGDDNTEDDEIDAFPALSLNEIYLLLRTCMKEAVQIAPEHDTTKRIGEIIGLIEGAENPQQQEGDQQQQGPVALDLAEVSTVLHQAFMHHRELRGEGHAAPNNKRNRAALSADNDFGDGHNGKEVAPVEDLLVPNAQNGLTKVNGDAVDAVVDELAAKRKREEEHQDQKDDDGLALNLPTLQSVALPGTARTVDSFDDVGNFDNVGQLSGDARLNAALGIVGAKSNNGVSAASAAAPVKQRRKAWTPEEDAAIIEGIAKYHGKTRFSLIYGAYRSVWQEGRTPAHIHDHWRQSLRAATFAATSN